MEKIKLTQYSKAAGCGCKIAPAILKQILAEKSQNIMDAKLLVGYDTADDAAVYDLGNGQALIATTDFFAPIVDDAYTFGRIAAANAISDVYAMGGKPLLALSILGWPVEKIPVELATLAIKGMQDTCKEAGIPIAGGHSINSEEPILGLSVNGLISKANVKTNKDAKPGDHIYITKPLGTGILTTAEKRGKLKPEDTTKATDVMMQLNKIGEELGMLEYVTAMTDITGFGLLGHLIEMCEGARLMAKIDYKKIPLIGGLDYYLGQYTIPDNTYRNWNAFEKKVNGIEANSLLTLCDPQTNGGLMICVSKGKQHEFETVMREKNQAVWAIGAMSEKGEKQYFVDVAE